MCPPSGGRPGSFGSAQRARKEQALYETLPKRYAALAKSRPREFAKFRKSLVEAIRKALGPHLKAKRIPDKLKYKRLCRMLTNKLLQKEKGNIEWKSSIPKKVGKYIDAFFEKHGTYDGGNIR